jgi:hypothetical protein
MSSGPSAGPGAVSNIAEPQVASNLLTSEQRLFAAQLEIPANMLCTGIPLSLQANYAHYLTYLDSCQKLAGIKDAGTWPSELKFPSSMDVILLFIGKSAWYDTWSKTFPHVVKYPEMVKWLKSEADSKPDLEVWGSVQNVYGFLDLIKWLENGGSLVVEKKSKKGKGKQKEKEKSKVSHKAGSNKGVHK